MSAPWANLVSVKAEKRKALRSVGGTRGPITHAFEPNRSEIAVLPKCDLISATILVTFISDADL